MYVSRVRTVLAAATALVFAAALALPIVQAQEATSTPEAQISTPITCDSALVLLTGLAVRDYGYVVPSNLGPFAWGQYSDMFQYALPSMATAEATTMASEASPMMTAEPTMVTTVALQPPVVLGEDPACTQLRSDVTAFFDSQISATPMAAG